MNKLRINPRGNNSRQSINSSDKDFQDSKILSSELNETLSYFLDKNVNEFTKDDLINFQALNQQQTDLFIETSKKVTNKLFDISKVLLNKKSESNKSTRNVVSQNEFVSLLPNNFKELKSLITEIIDDDIEENTSFLKILIDSLSSVDEILKKEEIIIDKLYGSLSELLYNLQSYNITQQKYIYRNIANIINKKLNNYNLISPEDGSFVDPKYHKIISGNGQRIVRGVSYILLDMENDEVLKFGNVKTI